MSDHISRKELKQDKVRETIEHGAEAVLTHTRLAAIVALFILVAASGYLGWTFYSGRQNAQASAALDEAMKTFTARLRTAGEPLDSGEITYTDESQRSQDASVKFSAVADRFPRTKAGKLARYYSALCLEDLSRHNQALEELKQLDAGSDKELAAMAQYQTALIYERSGKTSEAIKIYRALAEMSSILVPRPLVLLELAGTLRQSDPQGASAIYQQIKKEFPNTSISEDADRGLGTLSPKS